MSSFSPKFDPTISQDYTGGNAEREKDLLRLHEPAPLASLNDHTSRSNDFDLYPSPEEQQYGLLAHSQYSSSAQAYHFTTFDAQPNIHAFSAPQSSKMDSFKQNYLPYSPAASAVPPTPSEALSIQRRLASQNSHYTNQNYRHHPDPAAPRRIANGVPPPGSALAVAEAAARDRDERVTTAPKRQREWEDDNNPAQQPSTVNNESRTQRQWVSREIRLSPSEHDSLEQHKQINDSALSHSTQPHTKKRKLQDADLSAPSLSHNSSESQDVAESLLLQVEALKKENYFLQMQTTTEARKPRNFTSRPWILIHMLDSTFYFDAPQWKQIQDGSWDLESRKPISHFEVFLEKQRLGGVAFVVTLQYDRHDTRHGSYLTEQQRSGDVEGSCQQNTQKTIQSTVRPMHVSIRFLCEVLASAWNYLLDMDKNLKQIYDDEREAEDRSRQHDYVRWAPPGSDPEASFVQPNSLQHQDLPNAEVFFYHFHTSLQKMISAMGESNEKCRLNLLIRFMEDLFKDEYQEVRGLLSEGLVSGVYMKYLSAPGTVLISHENGNDIGYLQKSFFRDASTTKRSVEVMNWEFDGKFKMKHEKIVTDVEVFKHAPRRIASLEYYPLRYADPQAVQNLKDRGHKFWRCRKSAYVSYDGLDMKQEATYNDTRFLVDVRTYHTMHGGGIGDFSKSSLLSDALMDHDEPPAGGSFVYVLPASIYGFDMQEKQWVDLQVSNIRELEWNTESFENLAIDKDSKELINALVNNKIAAEKATDMVRGKGNGLIILLHGGPGTGKTLTAESVAEIAKKPLYRVTCGDIGTEPREVEKYLQKVFHLGKIWDCVVLLDEADVFLEQRTLSDLSRNALVSVFLRTLEYYDGILILTSNRVGTFDEAFKSRIQLALHYPNLDLAQRKQIWKNFTYRLDSLEEDVDIEAILESINKLAKHEMNGRQIRNAITTARQLALFKKETLTTKHLEHSIRVSGKFDTYLKEVHDEINDDEMARQSGFR